MNWQLSLKPNLEQTDETFNCFVINVSLEAGIPVTANVLPTDLTSMIKYLSIQTYTSLISDNNIVVKLQRFTTLFVDKSLNLRYITSK